jgi:acyl-CoA thioester hydrolase
MNQLPPTTAIQEDCALGAETEKWYEYPVRAQPHHTDYAGIVWHGAYLTWMESARVECLRELGIEFADLVALGCDLPVVDLSIRYHRPVRLGMTAVVRTRMIQSSKIRMVWDYRIQSPDGKELYTTAQVTLVAVDLEKGSVMRKLPPSVQDALVKFAS